MTEIELEITSLAAGGDGVGRDDGGRVTFIAGAAPGERVRARVVEAKKSFARAELLAVIRPSEARVEAPCPLASGACGGCPWMHVAAPAQLAAKHAIAANALRRLIMRGLLLPPPRAPVAPLRWRRRAHLRWTAPPLRLGFLGRASHVVADVHVCLQIDERLERAIAAFRARVGPHLDGEGELYALLGHAGEIHLVCTGGRDAAARAAASLVGEAGIAGVRVGDTRHGADRIEVEPGLRSTADAFAQASESGNAALVAEVIDAVSPAPGLRVLELHAGAGNFTRHLVAAGAVVVANDLAITDLPGARVVAGPAHEAVARIGRDRFDVLLLDPPRTGAAEVVGALIALGDAAPSRVVYVSCDAATLGRDLERLRDAGYAPQRAQVLDLFPQTAHLEIVARLERNSATLPP